MRLKAATLLLLLTAIGCGSSAPNASQPTPRLTGECAGVPVVDTQNPPDYLPLTADPVLEALIPTEIGGQPVANVASGTLRETLCVVGGPEMVVTIRSGLPAGVDLDAISVAYGDATVDAAGVTITGFRLAGGSADALVPALSVISATTSGSAAFTGDADRVSSGGKSVLRWAGTDEAHQTYAYPSGETVFILRDVTPSQADQVFAALP